MDRTSNTALFDTISSILKQLKYKDWIKYHMTLFSLQNTETWLTLYINFRLHQYDILFSFPMGNTFDSIQFFMIWSLKIQEKLLASCFWFSFLFSWESSGSPSNDTSWLRCQSSHVLPADIDHWGWSCDRQSTTRLPGTSWRSSCSTHHCRCQLCWTLSPSLANYHQTLHQYFRRLFWTCSGLG